MEGRSWPVYNSWDPTTWGHASVHYKRRIFSSENCDQVPEQLPHCCSGLWTPNLTTHSAEWQVTWSVMFWGNINVASSDLEFYVTGRTRTDRLLFMYSANLSCSTWLATRLCLHDYSATMEVMWISLTKSVVHRSGIEQQRNESFRKSFYIIKQRIETRLQIYGLPVGSIRVSSIFTVRFVSDQEHDRYVNWPSHLNTDKEISHQTTIIVIS